MPVYINMSSATAWAFIGWFLGYRHVEMLIAGRPFVAGVSGGLVGQTSKEATRAYSSTGGVMKGKLGPGNGVTRLGRRGAADHACERPPPGVSGARTSLV